MQTESFPNRRSWSIFSICQQGTRSWTYCKWQQHSLESAPHFSSTLGSNKYRRRRFILFCVDFSAIPFISYWWCGNFSWFHDESCTICHIPMNCGFEKFSWFPFRFLISFRFTQMKLNPLNGQIRHYANMFVIVSNFTNDLLLTNDSFCLKYCFVSAFLARNSCNLGSLAEFEMMVFGKKQISPVASLNVTFARRSESESAEVFAYCDFFFFEIFVNSFTTLGDLVMDFSLLDCWSMFCFLFWRDPLDLEMLVRGNRHIVVLLDLEKHHYSCPAAMMWKTNRSNFHNLTTISWQQ